MPRLKLRLQEEADGDDPVLSLVNLIDVFLVLVAVLLMAVARSPWSPFGEGQATLVRNPGTPAMEVMVKDGKTIERFRGEGARQSASGGVRAGSAYRMPDGALVYVPD